MVFVGAVLTYSIQFHDWKLAQLASILGSGFDRSRNRSAHDQSWPGSAG
jgi:hypothetical protein